MEMNLFWDIMEDAREDADGNAGVMCELLIKTLSELEVRDLMLWEQILDEYQAFAYKSKLWAAAFVINDGCSDDDFDAFRAWLTAQGYEVFHQALREPDSLAKIASRKGSAGFEALLSVPAEAYFKMRHVECCDYGHFFEALRKHPLPGEIRQKMWAAIEYASDIDALWAEEETLDDFLPALCKAFNRNTIA